MDLGEGVGGTVVVVVVVVVVVGQMVKRHD